MVRLVLKQVIPALVAATLSLCGLQALAQNLVTIPNSQSIPNLQRSSPVLMPTKNAQGQSLASTFARHKSGGSGLASGPRYPGDLQYHGGPVITTAENHTFYINPTSSCPPVTCWGNPISFLNDLGDSGMIHITDQYVGTTASNRYSVGTNFLTTGYTPIFGGTTFTDADIANLAYATGLISGFGPGHIYHVFLTPGQDLCSDNTYTVCYSPDNPATFIFCAYHNAAQDLSGNIVYYTAEPFQDVPGCSVQPGTPNGQVTDSTNDVLSHETFETITDPEPGTGWWNTNGAGMYGQEIGDECIFLLFTANAVYSAPSFVRLNGHSYAIQPEYVNSQHSCNTTLKAEDE